MKVGLISDTHGHTKLVEYATQEFEGNGVERIIHCGDVTRIEHIESLIHGTVPVHLVFGNCDFNTENFTIADSNTSLQCEGSSSVIELNGLTLGFTHGHYQRLLRQLEDEDPDYIIRGHTHERMDRRSDGIRYINPGAIKPPGSSIAVLDLDTDELTFFDIER